MKSSINFEETQSTINFKLFNDDFVDESLLDALSSMYLDESHDKVFRVINSYDVELERKSASIKAKALFEEAIDQSDKINEIYASTDNYRIDFYLEQFFYNERLTIFK